MRLLPGSAAAMLACLAACSGSAASPGGTDRALTLRFGFDAPVNGEQYECFGFDASALAGRWLQSITWTAPPPSNGVQLHHAGLYAFPEDYPDGPVMCDAMPVSWTMHMWAPGGDSLALPSGVALELPAGTKRFVVQAHVLRFTAGPPGSESVSLATTATAPDHVAAWLPADGAVPALRPRMQEHSTAACIAAAPMHIVSSWPHMHLLGTSFEGAVVRSDGTRTPIVDVPTWNFDAQRTYPVDRDVAAGDRIETDCTWFNPTDQYVLPGASTHDEMCAQGLIVWPAKTASWQSPCQ
jgi:hypothetical protein